MQRVELLAHSHRGRSGVCIEAPDHWPRSVACPPSPACCGRRMRPREPSPRGGSGPTSHLAHPDLWPALPPGASRSHACKVRSGYLLGVSAGLRRHYIRTQKVPTWPCLLSGGGLCLVTVFILLWVGFPWTQWLRLLPTDLQLHSRVGAGRSPGALSVATWHFCSGLRSLSFFARACNPPGGFCRWPVFSFLADAFLRVRAVCLPGSIPG